MSHIIYLWPSFYFMHCRKDMAEGATEAMTFKKNKMKNQS